MPTPDDQPTTRPAPQMAAAPAERAAGPLQPHQPHTTQGGGDDEARRGAEAVVAEALSAHALADADDLSWIERMNGRALWIAGATERIAEVAVAALRAHEDAVDIARAEASWAEHQRDGGAVGADELAATIALDAAIEAARVALAELVDGSAGTMLPLGHHPEELAELAVTAAAPHLIAPAPLVLGAADDEDVAELIARFEAGRKGVTAPPAAGQTVWLEPGNLAARGPVPRELVQSDPLPDPLPAHVEIVRIGHSWVWRCWGDVAAGCHGWVGDGLASETAAETEARRHLRRDHRAAGSAGGGE